MKKARSPPCLQALPEAALSLIVKHALGLSNDRVLEPNSEAQKTAVSLARTSRTLRGATAGAIHEVCFGDREGLWPSVRAVALHAWPSLRALDCTVNRSGLLGFLEWLVPATGIKCLRLRVVGEPYPESRLSQLERMLLGRYFTQGGCRLVELDVSGVSCQTLLFTAMFHCTGLRKLHIGEYGEDSASTLLNMFILLCLVNRDCLESVDFPFDAWRNRMEKVPDGTHLYAACEVTWATLWGSYRAGLKEAAVNLPSDESELVASFRKVSFRMDELELGMNNNMKDFKAASSSFESTDMPDQVLCRLLPKLLQVNNRPARRNENGIQ